MHEHLGRSKIADFSNYCPPQLTLAKSFRILVLSPDAKAWHGPKTT